MPFYSKTPSYIHFVLVPKLWEHKIDIHFPLTRWRKLLNCQHIGASLGKLQVSVRPLVLMGLKNSATVETHPFSLSFNNNHPKWKVRIFAQNRRSKNCTRVFLLRTLIINSTEEFTFKKLYLYTIHLLCWKIQPPKVYPCLRGKEYWLTDKKFYIISKNGGSEVVLFH